MTEAKQHKLYILTSEYLEALRLGLPTDHLEDQIDRLKWVLVDEDDETPPEFENLLCTCDDFDEAVIGGRWKDAWFLINDFEERFLGDKGEVKIRAWRYLPKIYR